MAPQPKRKTATRSYKVERLEARISSQEKATFAKAAAIQGRTLSEFVVSTLHEASAKIIESHEVLRLAEQDRKSFVQAMLNPPEPSENLKVAAQRYLKRRRSTGDNQA